jgi:hypothetical protein
MNREIAELFAKVEQAREKSAEMAAKLCDALGNGEISEKELKAISKAAGNATKAFRQAMDIAFKARSKLAERPHPSGDLGLTINLSSWVT